MCGECNWLFEKQKNTQKNYLEIHVLNHPSAHSKESKQAETTQKPIEIDLFFTTKHI